MGKAKGPRTSAAKKAVSAESSKKATPAKSARSWQEMSLPEFEAAMANVEALTKKYVGDVLAALGGTPTLTDEERRRAPRLREAQYDAWFAALDVADMRPETFKYLADKDKGKDPKKFETGLVRERLAKHKRFTSLQGAISPVADLFSDAPLALATQIAEPCTAAYALAKGLAGVDPEARSRMADALSAASRIARAAAKTRAENKKNTGK